MTEYLKDFEPYYAALRMGFIHDYALRWSKILMQDSYVRREITTCIRKPSENSAMQEIEDKALVENTYRQAMQHGPYASRVAAGRALAEMRGWTRPDGARDTEEGIIEVLRQFAQRAPV